MSIRPPSPLRRFARESRAGAGIEAALGGAAILTVAALCFDLYAVAKTSVASGRAAAAMADYIALDTTPDGAQVAALGAFLYRHKFDSPADLVYVISAVRPGAGGAPEQVWTDDTVRIGGETATDALAGRCALRGDSGWKNALLEEVENPGWFPAAGAVVVEVCARPRREGMLTSALAAGDLYGVHVVPARNRDQGPSQPVYP